MKLGIYKILSLLFATVAFVNLCAQPCTQPVAAFTVSPSILCTGAPIKFNATSTCSNNNALTFSGSSSANRSLLSTATNNITMEIWAKWSGSTAAFNNQILFYNGHTGNGGYGILMRSSGSLSILIGGRAYLNSTGSLTAGVWQHIAIVRNNGTWSLYLNGTATTVSNNTINPYAPNIANGNQTSIGYAQDGGQRFYGDLDEAKFWTVVRSTSDILTDMKACSTSATSGLLAYWGFNEGTGTTTADGSGNNYTLNLSNTTWNTAGAPTGGTYAWDFGGGVTAATPGVTNTFNSSVSPTVSLIATNNEGCSDTATTNLSINQSPTAIISGTATNCSSVSLTASGGNSYLWTGGNSVSTAANTFSSSGTYAVTVTDAIGCTAVTSQVVTVNSLPNSPVEGLLPVASTFVNSNLSAPVHSAFDKSGNLYVANASSNTIKKIDVNGNVSTFLGTGLNYPYGLAFDTSGNLYVANYLGNNILKVTSAGVASTFVSSGLTYPWSLAFDREGNLYTANSGNGTISKINSSGTVSTFVSSGLSSPAGLAFDTSGNLYIANVNGDRISKVTSNGTVSTFVNSGLSGPYGLAFDTLGNLFTSNHNGNYISKISSNGTVSTYLAAGNGVSQPAGISFDVAGNLFVSNLSPNTITKITAPVINNTRVINAGAVTLIASPASGETIDWFDASSNGSSLLLGNTNYTTPTISSTTTYYAQARNSTTGCISAARTPITALVIIQIYKLNKYGVLTLDTSSQVNQHGAVGSSGVTQNGRINF